MPKYRFRLSINFMLRLTLAFLFALCAFIFSEVIPDLPPFNHNFIRVAITIWSGMLGYGVFPDLAQKVSISTLHLSNQLIDRVTTEVTTQMMRMGGRGQLGQPTNLSLQPGGSVSISLPIVVDTSAIIDGRLLDIAKTGFLFGTLIIPTFVLTELQQVSDSSDPLKRTRGRQGFDTIEELKKIKILRIEIWQGDVAAKAVDDKLIKLAKQLHGKVLTTDFNLNRVASISGVTVLNINDLANAIKTVAVPGESLNIKLVHVGKDPKQAVGYLTDGTMVVVEDGGALLGQEIEVQVTRMLQSSAGRMIFAHTYARS